MKGLLIIVLMYTFIGCNSSKDDIVPDNNITVISPIDTNSTYATYKTDISNYGGSVDVKLTYTGGTGDEVFIIEQYIDGISYNTLFPTIFTSGALNVVYDVVSIPQNNSDSDIVNKLDIIVFTGSDTYVISSIDIVQSTFSEDTNLVLNVDSIELTTDSVIISESNSTE